jgi:hypothetical protein
MMNAYERHFFPGENICGNKNKKQTNCYKKLEALVEI